MMMELYVMMMESHVMLTDLIILFDENWKISTIFTDKTICSANHKRDICNC